MKNIFTKQIIIAFIISLIIGLIAGKFIFSSKEPAGHEHSHDADENTVWTCSMHPSVKQNEPGKCPICGMDLTPMEEGDGDDNLMVFKMSERSLALANLAYSKVKKEAADELLTFSAKIKTDERQQLTQSMHFPGRIEKLFVNFEGESVRAGQPLAKVYSPQLFNAQEELIQAKKQGDDMLLEAAKARLHRWKLSEQQIATILEKEESDAYFTIKADFSGYLLEKMVNEGDYVNRGQALFSLADLSKVWVVADVFEKDLSKIRKGQKILVSGSVLGTEKIETVIDYINPVINAQRRTATVRATIANPKGHLMPEMLVQAQVQISHPEKLIVPASAVMWTGERSIIYLADGKGNFELRPIKTGLKLGNYYEVTEGLEEGEQIVSQATFTVDAAAQLAGKYAMMNPEPGEKEAKKRIVLDEEAANYLQAVNTAYVELKNKLVKTDADNKSAINQLKNLLKKEVKSDLEGEELGQLRHYFKQAFKSIDNWPDDVEKQREQFMALSDILIELNQNYQGKTEKLYLQYCPMANDDNGAYWLSFEEEIYNPYFGDVMLHCGEVVDEI